MSYQGFSAPLPLGANGFNGSRNAGRLTPGDLVVAENLTYAQGTLAKEPGAEWYTATALSGTPTILAGVDWWPVDGVQRQIIYTSAGTLLRDDGDGTFPTTLASGLVGTMGQFVTAGNEAPGQARKLIFFTGVDVPRVLAGDAATATPLAMPNTDWTSNAQPRLGILYAQRLWVVGADDHRLYYSLTTNHEDFTSAGSGSLPVFPGEGEGIKMAVTYKGLLIVVKRQGVYAIDARDPDITRWTQQRITSSVGTVAPLGSTQTDNDILLLDTAGQVQALSAVLAFGDVAGRNLSDLAVLAPWIREQLNIAALQSAQMTYIPDTREVHVALPGVGKTLNTLRLVLDFNRPDLVRYRVSPRDTCTALWVYRDIHGHARPMAGDNAGVVWLLDAPIRTKHDTAYTSTFTLPQLDLSHADPAMQSIRKQAQFLTLTFEPRGTWNLAVTLTWDGLRTETKAIPMTAPRDTTTIILGLWQLGTAYTQLGAAGGAAVATRRVPLHGGGWRVQVSGSLATAGADFSLMGATLEGVPSDQRT